MCTTAYTIGNCDWKLWLSMRRCDRLTRRRERNINEATYFKIWRAKFLTYWNRSLVWNKTSKQKWSGSRQPPPDSGAPLLYRFVLQYGSFSRFLPWIRFWPGQFYNHKYRSIQEEFLAKTLEYYDFIMPRNGIYNFEGVESHRLCLSTGARTLWTKAATLWTKANWG
jgi:hypothetical protein